MQITSEKVNDIIFDVRLRVNRRMNVVLFFNKESVGNIERDVHKERKERS